MSESIDLDAVLRKVDAHIEEAKLNRDDGEYEDAIKELEAAVHLLDQSGWREEPSNGMLEDGENKVASKLADCLAMIGGNLRRLDRLQDALVKFERGRRFEQDQRYGVNSSYNLVNAITLPIEMGHKTASEQKSELLRAVGALEWQTSKGKRRRDRWAWADYGQCLLLLGDVDQARLTYANFKALAKADEIASHLAVLNRLQKALIDRDPTVAETLGEGIRVLSAGS